MSSEPGPNWHLREWCEERGKIQASLVNELGWNKSKASLVWNDRQDYRRDLVNELSAWLGIEPYELLMPPEEALALRELRTLAAAITAAAPAKR